MAIYSTSKTQTYSTKAGYGSYRGPVTDFVSVAVTTAMIDNANDEVELLWVPKGAVILGVELQCSDMDTGVSPALVWDVGDDGDEDRLLAAVTTGQSAARTDALASTGFLYPYAADTKLKAYVKTAAATGAAGTLLFAVTYVIDPAYSATALTAA